MLMSYQAKQRNYCYYFSIVVQQIAQFALIIYLHFVTNVVQLICNSLNNIRTHSFNQRLLLV